MEVVNAVADIRRIETCPLGISTHGANLCPLHRKVDQAVAAIMQVFSGSTLQDLLNDPRPNKPLCDAASTTKLMVKGSLAD